MEPRTQISLGIESFLDYLRETERELHIAEQTEQAANDATQDILHRLELCELEDVDAERLAYKLQEVRRQRREAKDRIDQTAPVAAWLEKKAVLDRLQQFRQAGGLGCLEAVASRCGGDLTADKLRGVLTGAEKLPIEQWRTIRRALDQLEEGADG